MSDGMIAAVQAGGRGRRIGGDKGLIPFRGRPLVSWPIEAAKTAGLQVIIVANNPGAYETFGLPVFPDSLPGMGPLSGLFTAFDRTGAEEVLLIGCDMPLVKPQVLRLIITRSVSASGNAIIPFVHGREQGLLALFRKSAIVGNMDAIQAGALQFNQFRQKLKKTLILAEEFSEVDPRLESFENINSQQDLENLENRFK